MSLVVVGSIALDTVITPKGRRDDAVGGSATFFSLAAQHFSPVSIVGVVGTDFPRRAIDEFKKRNIDLEGLAIKEGKTFRWGGEYKTNMKNRDTIFTELNVFKTFSPILPPSYKKTDFLFLANIHPELQLQVLDQMEENPLVGLDSMNHWIERSRDKLLEAISRSNIIIINDEEIIQLSQMPFLIDGVKFIQDHGPQTVIVKKGKYGAELFHGAQHAIYPICPEEQLIDPTGAGDAFAGGFMGFLASKNVKDLKFDDYREAMIYGTVMASFLVESFSTDKLESLNIDEINERMGIFCKLIS
ncbi:MAG: sugar kinase [Candidatus Marinimicrobia bacterium]|nr:sugar kinase [Candidatus Neomarinimicrobiota bacterium]